MYSSEEKSPNPLNDVVRLLLELQDIEASGLEISRACKTILRLAPVDAVPVLLAEER